LGPRYVTTVLEKELKKEKGSPPLMREEGEERAEDPSIKRTESTGSHIPLEKRKSVGGKQGERGKTIMQPIIEDRTGDRISFTRSGALIPALWWKELSLGLRGGQGESSTGKKRRPEDKGSKTHKKGGKEVLPVAAVFKGGERKVAWNAGRR